MSGGRQRTTPEAAAHTIRCTTTLKTKGAKRTTTTHLQVAADEAKRGPPEPELAHEAPLVGHHFANSVQVCCCFPGKKKRGCKSLQSGKSELSHFRTYFPVVHALKHVFVANPQLQVSVTKVSTTR